MRSFETRLDAFLRKHPRFEIPNLMRILVIGTAIVYVLDLFSSGTFSSLLAFVPYYIFRGQIWRLVTFVFVPEFSGLGGVFWFAISLYFYLWIGTALEREWGSARFTAYYAIGVLVNIIGGVLFHFLFGGGAWVTASVGYLNLSLFFAFATLYPDMQVLIFFILPVKVKWLAWVDAAFFVWGIVSNLFRALTVSPIFLAEALLPVLAILNYLLFFGSDLLGFVRRKGSQVKHQTSRQTINFKKATAEAKREKGYIHKCAVCGKTDTDYPNEEFRYCSKCNGYYCYCSAHIHNHVHIE